jgi:hypothetical protein
MTGSRELDSGSEPVGGRWGGGEGRYAPTSASCPSAGGWGRYTLTGEHKPVGDLVGADIT